MPPRKHLARIAWEIGRFCSTFCVFVALIGPTQAKADVNVLDQDGRNKLFFRDVIGDDATIINFVYTHCQGVCPNQGKRFEQLQNAIDQTKRADVKLVSLSIDPERDSPDDLKRWSQRFGAGKNWTLVVASRADTDALTKQILGMTLSTGEHSPYLAIGDKKGRWQPLYGLTPLSEILTSLDVLTKTRSH